MHTLVFACHAYDGHTRFCFPYCKQQSKVEVREWDRGRALPLEWDTIRGRALPLEWDSIRGRALPLESYGPC